MLLAVPSCDRASEGDAGAPVALVEQTQGGVVDPLEAHCVIASTIPARGEVDDRGSTLGAGVAAMGHVWRDHNAVARVRDTSLVADRESQFAADDDRDLLLRMVVYVGDRVGLKGDEVRHHRVGGDRLEGDAGHEVERGKVAEVRPATGLVGGYAGRSK